MTPPEPPKEKSQAIKQGKAELYQRQGLSNVDPSGLLRAITLLEHNTLDHEATVSLLKHETSVMMQQANAICAFAQQISIELRQVRETKEQEILAQVDGARKIQDGNDKFVAQLMAEHETLVRSLQSERDAAMDRVRELSRGLSRVGTVSTPNLRRVSVANLTAANPADREAPVLRARVDELLFERERSLKLLRQLAEQRDQAESRLQMIVASVTPQADSPEPSNRPRARRVPTNMNIRPPENSNVPLGAFTPAISREPTETLLPLVTPAVEPAVVAQASGANSAVVRAASPAFFDSNSNAPEENSDWDLSRPEKLPVSVPPPALLAKVEARVPSITEEVSSSPLGSETSLPLLRKKANYAGDGIGSYSISASELPAAEEVVVVRSRPSQFRPSR